MNIMSIGFVREKILDDLKERFNAGDKSVLPLDDNTSHRWYHPQKNYFSGHGNIKCPICADGRVSYTRSSYNGHIHAACSTIDCVKFIE